MVPEAFAYRLPPGPGDAEAAPLLCADLAADRIVGAAVLVC